jgi:hypothetical protein
LRFKDKTPREWKVPFNIKIGKIEIPLGLTGVALILFALAAINLITKQVATISGLFITALFATTFFISERITQRRRLREGKPGLDQFRLEPQENISMTTVGVRPDNTLCLVRDYNTLDHVTKVLELTHTGKKDLVIMTVHVIRGPNAGYKGMSEQRLFTDYEQLLFSKVVALAEKAGKRVHLLVVPSPDIFSAIAESAAQLYSSLITAGSSSVMTPEEQARRMGMAWDRLPNKPKHQVIFRVIEPSGKLHDFSLGAHAPELSDEEIEKIHAIWLQLTSKPGGTHLHHKDIVTMALELLEREISGKEWREILDHVTNDHEEESNLSDPSALK